MNIKDSYLHGGVHVVKDITFSVPTSGDDSGKVVANITWAEEGSTVTLRVIPVSSSVFGSLQKNKVFASPANDNGAPGFRSLVSEDIPNLNADKISAGIFDGARIPFASDEAKGGFILGIAQNNDIDDEDITGKKYWVKMNNSGKLFVDIPWDDNEWTANTKDSAGYVSVPKEGNNYLINKVWKTDNQGNPGWRDDTDTWIAASTAAAGYIPLLTTSQDTLSSLSTDYVLAYPSGVSGTTTPSWRRLPINAYLNTWTAYVAPTSSTVGTSGYITAALWADVNKFLRGDGTWLNPYFAIEKLTDWASVTDLTISGTSYRVMWTTAPTSTNQIYGLAIHNGQLYRVYNNNGTYSIVSYAEDTNTWRPIRVSNSEVVSNSIGTKGLNFINGTNTTVVYTAAGTEEGYSGSSDYFNIKINAIDTTYILKIGTASDAQDVVTLLNGTSSTSNTIITNTAYNLSSNKIATMQDIYAAVGSVFVFKGDITTTPSASLKVGYAYRASLAFTLADSNSATGSNESIEIGDLLVCTDASTPKFLVVNTNWTVSLPNSNVLSTSATTIATVGGVAIQATLPAASRDTSSATPGVISLNPGTGTSYYLREDGTWHNPNVTSALYIGALNGESTTNTALTNGNVYLIFNEGSVYSRFRISGSGSTSVTTDTSGNISINSTVYSPFVKSGNGHAAGLVPDPGDSEGTTKFLCEDGTWKLPSYTTDTNRAILVEGTSKIDSSTKTALNFVGGGATSVTYTALANSITYGTITISSNNDLVKFSSANASTTYYLPLKNGTEDSAQLLYTSGITVTGNTITASLNGNANTASNLNKGNSRGFLYQDGASSTSLTGYGTRNTSKIGIPYVYHTDTDNDTYELGENFFYKSNSVIYLSNNISSTKFVYVAGSEDDWANSPTT